MADTSPGTTTAGADPDVLDTIQQRVLWLATRIVDAANHDRRSEERRVGKECRD